MTLIFNIYAKSTTTWTPILIQVGHFNKLIQELKCRWTRIKNLPTSLPLFLRIDSLSRLKTWDRWTMRSNNASPTVWFSKWFSHIFVSYWLVIRSEPLSLCLSISLIQSIKLSIQCSLLEIASLYFIQISSSNSFKQLINQKVLKILHRGRSQIL